MQKEVERRRRSNINDGINELARMVPNVGAEKAKGAILSRSVSGPVAFVIATRLTFD
jgi:hypothetical protein